MTTIYNNTAQVVSSNGTYAITNIANQKGNCTSQVGNGIRANANGIYEITATITGLVTGGGIVNAQVYVNGVAIPYLIASGYSDTGEPTTLTINGTYIVEKNNSNNNSINTPIFTIVNNGTTTVNGSFASLNVTKI